MSSTKLVVENLLHTVVIDGDVYSEVSDDLERAINDPANAEEVARHEGSGAIVLSREQIADPWQAVPHADLLKSEFDSPLEVAEALENDVERVSGITGIGPARIEEIREVLG